MLCACSLNVAIYATVQTGTNIALPFMQQGLAFSNEIQSWVVNSFTLGSACTFIIFGKIARMITPRLMYITGMLLMALASTGCALSHHAWLLLTFRFIQGIAIAMTAPTAITLIRDAIIAGSYDKYFGWFITINTSYFIFAPTIAGYVIEYFGWRALYWLPLPLCFMALIAIKITVSPQKIRFQKMDIYGSFLLSIGTFLLIFVLMNIGFDGISVNNIVLFTIFIGLSFLLIKHAKNTADPIIPLKLFKNPDVIACASIGFSLQGSLMVMVFISLLLLEYFKLSAVQAGYFFMLAQTSGLISPYIFGRLASDNNRKRMVIATFICLLITFIGLGLSALNSRLYFCFGFTFAFAFFLGPLLSALPSHIAASIDDERISQVNSIVFHFRYLGASLCMAIMGVLAYSGSSKTDANFTNIDFVHLMIFMVSLLAVTIVLINQFMQRHDKAYLNRY